MPDLLITTLRDAAGPDREPDPSAREVGLVALQREIDRELAAPRRARQPRRRRAARGLLRARLAVPVLGLCAAALAAGALIPGHGPGAADILERAAAAVAPGSSDILFAESTARRASADGQVDDYGVRRIWVHEPAGAKVPSLRWLSVTGGSGVPAGGEDVSGPGGGQRYDPIANRITSDETTGVPTSIFRAEQLLERARAGKADVQLAEVTLDGRAAYRLQWRERLGTSGGPEIRLTLWVDRESYAPLRYEDHSTGRDAEGRPLDETFTETVTKFERLPDTPENRKLLEMGPHPGADRG